MGVQDSLKRPGESETEYLFRLAEQSKAKRERGRSAILNQAEDFDGATDEGAPPAGGKGGKGGGGGGGDDGSPDRAPIADHVMIPRLIERTVRWVPISMPDAPPITALGVNGRTYWYLSPLGQLIGLEDSEHGQAHIEGLWSPQINALHRAFPQFDQSNRFKGFQAQYARAAMFGACGLKGLFDAHERVRGLGCWKDDDGQLVQHLGDRVLVSDREEKPGEIGVYVYPGRPSLLPPKRGGKVDCLAIYDRMQLWNFERGEVDARLLLGQLAAGVLGAAIEWRPMAFLTGDAGTGKSTLQRLVRALLGKRMISTVDASEAALRALLGQDALAVSFDEIEADAHNDKAQAVMKLARTSASGDDAHRSGSDQKARSFTLRGSFVFSAIVPPSMRQQDMQRFAFLRLNTLKRGAKLPKLTSAELKDMGQGLVGRITEGWPRWELTLETFTQALEKRGHEHRGAMQFGTMLAAAHILLEDGEPSEEELTRWCDPLHRDNLFEYENSAPAWLTAWRIILTSCPELWRSHGSPTVANVIRRWLVAKIAGPDAKEEEDKLHGWLNQVGLALVGLRGTNKVCLAISPNHQALASIFKGTDFQAHGGGGAWNIPLRGAPKLDGDKGVLHVEKVSRLGRDKCPMFWLDGEAEIAGQMVKLFERSFDDDQVDGPPAVRVANLLKAYADAESREDLLKAQDRAVALRGALEPDKLEEVDMVFNARWAELDDQPPS